MEKSESPVNSPEPRTSDRLKSKGEHGMSAQINTPFGKKTVVRRVGSQKEYYLTLPTAAAPNGEWWVLNPQSGFVPVPSNGRALVEALAREV